MGKDNACMVGSRACRVRTVSPADQRIIAHPVWGAEGTQHQRWEPTERHDGLRGAGPGGRVQAEGQGGHLTGKAWGGLLLSDTGYRRKCIKIGELVSPFSRRELQIWKGSGTQWHCGAWFPWKEFG